MADGLIVTSVSLPFELCAARPFPCEWHSFADGSAAPLVWLGGNDPSPPVKHRCKYFS